jgi:hypothetical protein
MQKPSSPSSILISFFALFLFSLLTTQTHNFSTPSALAASPCTTCYTPGIPIPSGYGAAYDLTGGGQTEVAVSCTSPTAGTLTVGRNNTSDYEVDPVCETAGAAS